MKRGILVAMGLGAALWACGSSGGGGTDAGSGQDGTGQDLSKTDTAPPPDPGACTPGSKGTGEPCTQASECASCECEDVDKATKGQFRVCTTTCTNHAACATGEVCLYPTVHACVLKCTTAADCPQPYTACEMPTGAYKFCLVP